MNAYKSYSDPTNYTIVIFVVLGVHKRIITKTSLLVVTHVNLSIV